MNTTTGDPGQPGGPPRPRPAYPPCLPVPAVMRLLAADGWDKISVTTENSGQAIEAASDVMRASGLIPGREEP
jgi:hypothetical protein